VGEGLKKLPFSPFLFKINYKMNTIQNSANAKNAILAFVRNLVSKATYKAIKYLLDPCCPTNNITGVTFTASEINGNLLSDKNVTVIIIADGTNPIYVGKGVATLNGAGSGSL